MSVDVVCPSCAARFKAPAEMAGKKARCSKCGAAFRLPGTTAAAAPLPVPTDEAPPPERPRYVRPGQQQSNHALRAAVVLGVIALGSAAAAIVVLLKSSPEPPPTPTGKTETAAVQPPAPPPVQTPTPTEPAKPSPQSEPKTKEPKPKEPTTKEAKTQEPPPVVIRPDVPGLPPGVARVVVPPSARTFQLRPVAAKPELLQPAGKSAVAVDVPVEKMKRMFPALSRATHDTILVWQSQPGRGGRGQRFTVDIYSGMIGVRTGRFEYDSDGSDARCDVSADGKLFAAVCTDGKLSVWNVLDMTPVLDGYDPYADLPEQKKAGLAAVFFADRPEHLVTVSTAGAVHLHDTTKRQRISEFQPPRATAGSVRLGANVAVTENRSSVVVVVAGVIHQIATTAPLKRVQQVELGGEVIRSLGVAVVGTPGRIAYAFETGTDTRQQAVFLSLPNQKPTVFLWPATAGEPTGLHWSGTNFAIVSTTRGAVWIEAADKQFTPLALGEVAGGQGLHAATESGHWYLVPQPGDPNRSVLVELTMPLEGLLEFRAAAEARQPLETVRLDDKGLSK